MPGRAMHRAFFELSPDFVAPRLLGKILAHRHSVGRLGGANCRGGPIWALTTNRPTRLPILFVAPRHEIESCFGAAAHAYGLCNLRPLLLHERHVRGRRTGRMPVTARPRTDNQLDQMAFNRGIPTGSRSRRAHVGTPAGLCQALVLREPRTIVLILLDPESPLQAARRPISGG